MRTALFGYAFQEEKMVKIMLFDDFLQNQWFLANFDITNTFDASFHIEIGIVLYYFDDDILRYKPSKIHKNPGFRPALTTISSMYLRTH